MVTRVFLVQTPYFIESSGHEQMHEIVAGNLFTEVHTNGSVV